MWWVNFVLPFSVYMTLEKNKEMGFSSLIPKTGGRRSIDNIVVPRELLRIVREKEHRFLSFLALWSKKEGRDYSPKELPLCIWPYDHIARKCKNTKKNTKNNHRTYAWTESGRIGENKKYSEVILLCLIKKKRSRPKRVLAREWKGPAPACPLYSDSTERFFKLARI